MVLELKSRTLHGPLTFTRPLTSLACHSTANVCLILTNLDS